MQQFSLKGHLKSVEQDIFTSKEVRIDGLQMRGEKSASNKSMKLKSVGLISEHASVCTWITGDGDNKNYICMYTTYEKRIINYRYGRGRNRRRYSTGPTAEGSDTSETSCGTGNEP